MTEPVATPPASTGEPLRSSTVALRDGTELMLIPMQATDSERLTVFHHTLSAETTYLRFFFFHPELSSDEVRRFTQVDHRDREAIVALSGDAIVGVARFDRLDDEDEAEVAFVVADSWQGRGVGSVLFDELIRVAIAAGVKRFVADTLAHNRRMRAVFHRAQGTVTERVESGVVHVTVDLAGATSS